MTGAQKIVLLALGFLSAFLIIAQLVLGQLLASGSASEAIRKSHQHTGYTAVAASLVYILLSLWFAINAPTRTKSGEGDGR